MFVTFLRCTEIVIFQLKGKCYYCKFFFLTQSLLFSFENSNAVRSYRRLLRNNYRWFEHVWNTYSLMLGSTSRRHFVCQRQPSVSILDRIKHALQRHTVTEEIYPIAPALDWQCYYCKFFFLTQSLLFSFENSNAVRSYRRLLRIVWHEFGLTNKSAEWNVVLEGFKQPWTSNTVYACWIAVWSNIQSSFLQQKLVV